MAPPAPVVLTGRQVRLVPVADAHIAELRRIRATSAVAQWWGTVDPEPWPREELEEGEARFAVLEGDGPSAPVRGMIQYFEEADPMYRHASIDIFLDPAAHGRGLGQDAVGALVRHLLTDRGHHRLVIDPAATNTAAIRCYAAVGFQTVGVMRAYERDADGSGWHDGVLMELIDTDSQSDFVDPATPMASEPDLRTGPAD
jgi:RimJ/RimL family protein N-acetyltransferase